MNTTPVRGGVAALLLPAFLAVVGACALAGCANESGYVAYNSGPAYVDSDDYVYYPGYEVYYSTVNHVYVYRDHDRWVRRSSPPSGFVQGSASVRMNWHDSPEHHHAEVEHSYPRSWHPQSAPPAHVEEHRGDNDHRKDEKKKKDKDHRDDDQH